METMGVGIPHYVQKYFAYALDECKANHRTGITLEDIDVAYSQRMLGSLGQADLTSYYERIQRVLGEVLMPVAIELLTETAVKNVLTESTIAKVNGLKGFENYDGKEILEVLEILMHDGYLKRENNKYSFVSKLLKDWWKIRYGTGYVSIQHRVRGK